MSFCRQLDKGSGKLEELDYAIIIGRDLPRALKVIIDFEYLVIKWDDFSIPMNETKVRKKQKRIASYFQLAMEPKTVQQDVVRVSKAYADMKKVMAKETILNYFKFD